MLKWMPVPVLIGSLQNIYMERWFELFVGKFNMDVDVIDASPQMLEFHRENFQDHSEVIPTTVQDRYEVGILVATRFPAHCWLTNDKPTRPAIR
jgi:hypothetical protein